MPHEVETMAYVQKTEADIPWHRLGNPVAAEMTAVEALEAGQLNWDVETRPLLAAANGVSDVHAKVPDKRAVVRSSDGAVLGIVGSRYTPVQNAEVFDFIDNLVDSGDAKYETVGSLKEGRIVWMLARIDRTLEVDDEIIPYLLGTTSHDGSSAVRMLTTPVRVVCANTHGWALRTAKSSWSIRHTKFANAKVQNAREALQLAHTWYDAYEDDVDRLMNSRVTDERFDDIVKNLFPVIPEMTDRQQRTRIERRKDVARIYFDDPTIRDFTGTGWGVVNAANSFELWHQPVRGDRAERQAMKAIRNRQPLSTRARQLVIAS